MYSNEYEHSNEITLIWKNEIKFFLGFLKIHSHHQNFTKSILSPHNI